VLGCDISSDCAQVVSASNDKTLILWDAATGRALRRFEGHTRPVFSCAFSPDHSLIASASEDGTLRVWDAEGGDCRATVYVDGALWDCAWMPDCGRLVAAGDAGVYFLRLVRSPVGTN